jgi:sulfate-transporting ATPase
VLKNIHLSFFPGAKIGVLGANGSGKSTLLKIMAGVETEFLGEAWAAEGVKIGYLPQEPSLEAGKTVHETVMEGMGETKALLDRFNEVSARFAEEMTDDEMNALLAEQSDLQEKIDAANAWDIDRTIDIAMDALRLPPPDVDVGPLSGGEKRRVALCRLLLAAPDMLLLDEPTNHLDAESVTWLQRFLHDFPGTVVTVTHDRYLLVGSWSWIVVRAFPMRVIIPVGLSKSRRGCSRRAATRSRAPGCWLRNWNGCAPRREPAKQRARPGLVLMRSCWHKAKTRPRTPLRSLSRPAPASVTL